MFDSRVFPLLSAFLFLFFIGEENEIFRGIWFYDGYEPYEYGEEVESEHLNLFRDSSRRVESNDDNGKSGTN